MFGLDWRLQQPNTRLEWKLRNIFFLFKRESWIKYNAYPNTVMNRGAVDVKMSSS